MANRTQDRSANAPDYRIIVNGQVITPRFRGLLSQLTLTDNRGGEADELDLVINDNGNVALPPKGATVKVALGWRDTGLVERGSYTVDEIEWTGEADQIHIRARSANFRDTLPNKRTRSWDNLTIADIVEAIAERYGLDTRIGDPLGTQAIAHIDQTNESDVNFLTRLAKRFDAMATVKNELLLFMPAGTAATATGAAIPAVTLTRRMGSSPRYRDADRDSYSGVIAKWHDTQAAKKQKAIAGSEANAKTLRETYATLDDALAAAQAEWARIQRGKQSFSFTLAHGRPDLFPETPITASGFKLEIDATPWLITRVTHNFADSGYTNELEMEVATSENRDANRGQT